MPPVSTRAVILQAFAYSDTSKILRLLTADHGVRSVIAKGALRPKSRYGGLLEPFTEGDAQLFLKEGRDLHTLNGFDLVRSRQAIGRNLAAFAGASLVAELVLRFSTEEPHPEIFAAVVEALDVAAAATPAAAPSEALASVWQVIALLGYEPQLRHCVGCGRAVEPGEATRFDVDAGGVACTLCRREGRLVEPSARRALEAMIHGDLRAVEPADWPLHRALLRAFLTTHLVGDRPLRALDLFLEELQAPGPALS